MNLHESIQGAFAKVQEFNSVAGNLEKVTEESVDNQIGYVFEELTETITAFEEGDKPEFLKEVCDLFVTVAGLMQKMEKQGYKVAEALTLVNENNLSKFPPVTGAVQYEEGHILTKNIVYGRYVIKDVGGKVRKPSNFVKVDLSDLFKGQ